MPHLEHLAVCRVTAYLQIFNSVLTLEGPSRWPSPCPWPEASLHSRATRPPVAFTALHVTSSGLPTISTCLLRHFRLKHCRVSTLTVICYLSLQIAMIKKKNKKKITVCPQWVYFKTWRKSQTIARGSEVVVWHDTPRFARRVASRSPFTSLSLLG